MNSGRTAFVRYSLRKGLMVVPAVFAAMVVFSAALCPGAAAATKPGDIVTYSLDGSQPGPITAGPDGNLWFGEYNASSGAADVGKITTTGKITIYSIPGGTGYGPGGITSGPDGNIWFTEVGSDGYIGRITPDGTVTVVAPVAWPREIAPGPGGNLWFTTGAPGEGQLGRLGRISPTGKITIFSDPGIHSPQGITEGPDGNMWFIDPSEEAVGRITPRGNVTTFTSPHIYQPYDITLGPDGALWFTSPGDSTIGRVTTAGAVSTYSGGGIARPFGIATGPDEALWFTGTSEIGRITTGGALLDPPVLPGQGIAENHRLRAHRMLHGVEQDEIGVHDVHHRLAELIGRPLCHHEPMLVPLAAERCHHPVRDCHAGFHAVDQFVAEVVRLAAALQGGRNRCPGFSGELTVHADESLALLDEPGCTLAASYDRGIFGADE